MNRILRHYSPDMQPHAGEKTQVIQRLTRTIGMARITSERRIPLPLKELAWGSATWLHAALSLNDDSQSGG
jgi:hypothetical protein